MHGRRTRALITSAFLLSGVASVAVSPVAAATCTLTAPASVSIGSTLTIDGSGFPASTAVDVSITIEGGSPDEFSAQSDATGAFQISLTPEAADAGMTTVVASAGAGCSAQVVVAVGTTTGGGTPEPTEAGAAGAGAEPSGGQPPTTDGVSASQTAPASSGVAAWLALILLSAGIGGLLLTRPARSR
jgi:hypothetical protein